jgi:dihydrofolate reductase
MEPKRRIHLYDHLSADGYFSSTEGRFEWAVPDDEIDRRGAGNIPDCDTILFGRKTYEAFASFWPHALDDPKGARDPHVDDRRSDAIQKMAVWINQATKIVFSRSLEKVTWQGTRLVRNFDPREIAAMKQQPGKDMMIFGSGTISSLLTQHRLIDEYTLVVSPLFLGGGRTLISGVDRQQRLELREATPYRSGNVLLRYAPAP